MILHTLLLVSNGFLIVAIFFLQRSIWNLHRHLQALSKLTLTMHQNQLLMWRTVAWRR